jgi:hypothetical protein
MAETLKSKRNVLSLVEGSQNELAMTAKCGFA